MSLNRQSSETSPPWSNTTKALVGLLGLVLFAVLLVRFKTIVTMFLLSLILSFLVTPFIRWLHVRARFSWGVATNICFLFLILLIIVASTALGLVVVQQLQALFQATQNFLVDLSAGGFTGKGSPAGERRVTSLGKQLREDKSFKTV